MDQGASGRSDKWSDSGSGSIIHLVVVSEGLKGVKDDPKVLEVTTGGAELSFPVYGDEDWRGAG